MTIHGVTQPPSVLGCKGDLVLFIENEAACFEVETRGQLFARLMSELSIS